MKNLQEQYNLISEGKGNRDIFLRESKKMYPHLIRNSSGFNEVVKTLKHNHLLFENNSSNNNSKETDFFKSFKSFINENKAIEKKTTKEVEDLQSKAYDNKDKTNIDNVFGMEFLKGFYTEMGDPKNEKKSVEDLKKIVAKNLAKDPLFYVKDGQFGVKGIGYKDDTPGLKSSPELKGKWKSSGYGDLDKNTKETLKESVLKILNEKTEYFPDLESAKDAARKESEEGYTVHVEKVKGGGFRLAHWFDSNKTVASYEGGRYLEEGIHDRDITSAPHTNIQGEMGPYDPKAAAEKKRLANFGPKPKVTETMGDPSKEYMISGSGRDEFREYVLETPDGLEMIHMTFSSPEEALKYMKKKGLTLAQNIGYGISDEESDEISVLAHEILGDDVDNEEDMWDNDMWDDGELDPAGGYGPSSHLEEKDDQGFEDEDEKENYYLDLDDVNESNEMRGYIEYIYNPTTKSVTSTGKSGVMSEYGIGWYEVFWNNPSVKQDIQQGKEVSFRESPYEDPEELAEDITEFISKEYNINENKNTMIKLIDLLESEDRYYHPKTTNKKSPAAKNANTKPKRPQTKDKIKAIEEQGNIAALEAKIGALDEEITSRNEKIDMVSENDDLTDFINPQRIKEMKKEIQELVKTKEGYEKKYEKLTGEPYIAKKEEIVGEEIEENNQSQDKFSKRRKRGDTNYLNKTQQDKDESAESNVPDHLKESLRRKINKIFEDSPKPYASASWKAGYKAFKTNSKKPKNPYPKTTSKIGTTAYENWEKGWEYAQNNASDSYKGY